MTTALLVIDMQMDMTFVTEAGADRANPDAEARVADLLALFRGRGLPVIHVHHDETGGGLAAGTPGHAPMPGAAPLAGEPVLVKQRSSAFAGTGLAELLAGLGVTRLVIAGAEAGFCITSSTRMASDLGYSVILASDALIGFDLPRADGSRIAADEVLDVTLALLGAGFARPMPTAGVADAL